MDSGDLSFKLVLSGALVWPRGTLWKQVGWHCGSSGPSAHCVLTAAAAVRQTFTSYSPFVVWKYSFFILMAPLSSGLGPYCILKLYLILCAVQQSLKRKSVQQQADSGPTGFCFYKKIMLEKITFPGLLKWNNTSTPAEVLIPLTAPKYCSSLQVVMRSIIWKMCNHYESWWDIVLKIFQASL